MEWPSARVEKWAGASATIGFGFLVVPDTVTLHQLRFAILFWVAAFFIFICGFPAVQKQLRTAWRRLVILYRRTAVSYPRGALIAAALAVVMVGVLLIGGGSWVLLGGNTPSVSVDRDEHSKAGRTQADRELVGQVAELQKKVGPRYLTQEQKALLVKRLKGQDAGCALTISTEKDENTAKYAADFIEVFEKAGWKPQKRVLSGVRENVWIAAKPGNSVASFLFDRFRDPDVDIEVELYQIESPFWQENEIRLSIGPQQVYRSE